MSMLLLWAMAVQSAPVATKLNVAEPTNCTLTPRALGCPGRKGDRYRLHGGDQSSFDRKHDAMKQNDAPCGLIGVSLCTRKPRTILKSSPE